MDKTPASFHERLALAIHTLRIKDTEFAQRVGLSKQTLSNYILGNTEPSQSKMAEWVKAFRINANWLLTGEGEMFGDKPSASTISLPEEEISEKLTPEQRNMLTYKRLQTELGTPNTKIADGLDAIISGKCVSDRKKGYGVAEDRGLHAEAPDKVQEESAKFGDGI